MDYLQKFSSDGRFIIAFLIVCIVTYTFAPDALYYVLILILIGQVLINFEDLKNLTKYLEVVK
jgi:hypothetical protein